MKAFFSCHWIAEIIVQAVRVFPDVVADLAQQVARPWPARTFRDVRVALFPRAQMPVLRPVPVISVFHSFLSALLRRDDDEFLYPKRAGAGESCSSFIFAIAFFGFIPREP